MQSINRMCEENLGILLLLRFNQGTYKTIKVLHYFFNQNKIVCILEGWVRFKKISKCKKCFFPNGLTYFWRTKQKQ